MRTYYMTVHGPRGAGHTTRVVTTPLRIRAAVVIAFRKWFGGRSPNRFVWGQDGFMAEASDKRGNHLTLEQENWWHPFAPGATNMPRPCVPMLSPKR